MKVDRAQFEKLALEQLDMLYRMARRITRTPAAAEDLVQETYLRALRGREGFELNEYGIRPWMLRIMHNLHLSRSEKERREPATVADEQLERPNTAHANDLPPIDPASWEGMDERLVKALNALPDEYRIVLLLWAVEGLSYKEIASALIVPLGTVMSRLHRARQRLAAQLRQYATQERIIRE